MALTEQIQRFTQTSLVLMRLYMELKIVFLLVASEKERSY